MRVTPGEPTQTHEHSRLSVKRAALHHFPKSCGLFLAIEGGQWYLFDRQEAAVFSDSIIGTMALERSRFNGWKCSVCYKWGKKIKIKQVRGVKFRIYKPWRILNSCINGLRTEFAALHVRGPGRWGSLWVTVFQTTRSFHMRQFGLLHMCASHQTRKKTHTNQKMFLKHFKLSNTQVFLK